MSKWKSALIISLLLLSLLPATLYATPEHSTPQLTDGAAQMVSLRTGPGYRYPTRYAVDAEALVFTARHGNWVQVGLLGWLEVDTVDPKLPDVSDLLIADEFNGVIVGVMPMIEDE